MTRVQVLTALMHFIIFMLGAGIGSFLNVVIYRLPLGISVNNPRRSFCPSCRKQIPAWQNIPLFSWLMLRGKCANCGVRISFRYFFVELLTGVLFYAEFRAFGGPWEYLGLWGPMLLLYWIFTALLVSGTFIDFDHFILPHIITLGGLAVGLLGSFWVPRLMGVEEHGRGLLVSFSSACVGLGLLWTVVELGKLAFGRLSYRPMPPKLRSAPKPVVWLVSKLLCCEWIDRPQEWNLSQPDEDKNPVFKFGSKEIPWEDMFGMQRKSDRLLLTNQTMSVFTEDGDKLKERKISDVRVDIRLDKITLTFADGKTEVLKLETVKRLSGTATEMTMSREAMGFGDVLLLAMIGSFLGWKAVLFVIVGASVIGTLCAVVPRIIGKTEWTAMIPFGPYLACAALIWLFYGEQILSWYLDRVHWSR